MIAITTISDQTKMATMIDLAGKRRKGRGNNNNKAVERLHLNVIHNAPKSDWSYPIDPNFDPFTWFE